MDETPPPQSPPSRRPTAETPHLDTLSAIKIRCARIRARSPERPGPWQEAVASYLASEDLVGESPGEKAETIRLLARARHLLEASGLEADPGALTRADMLYLHARRARMPGDGRGVLAALGRFLEWWKARKD